MSTRVFLVVKADQIRSNLTSSMWNNVINAWWPLVFYPATDAPKFKKGMWAMIGTAGATLLVTWLVWYLERREKRAEGEDEKARGRDGDNKSLEVLEDKEVL